MFNINKFFELPPNDRRSPDMAILATIEATLPPDRNKQKVSLSHVEYAEVRPTRERPNNRRFFVKKAYHMRDK